ncbi:MarR family transcriptional regulator [Rudanella paleaurantiibacter]|uniref:MarR family transcriptional regulator n=1 Tax=Rudanella paleaurantiibacter TaxID=2614655 RepID=A0A7J5U0Y5_9BACT|nr:MarR family winged helix-turn-helix transcriptional regulator [Rudanella paleaurantiibacter]KAB7731287.1 MarR family transcriptional regulator [Rudanella paleaurantiibacter]
MKTESTSSTAECKSTRYSACLLFSANALARAITTIGDEEFGKLGLTYSHAYLLREVIDNPGVTPTHLSETLRLTPSTITRLIEKLELKGLVTRRHEGKNTFVDPTDGGTGMSNAIMEAWQRTGARYAEAIGEEQVKALTQQVFGAARALGEV